VSNVRRQEISQPQRYDTYALNKESNCQRADIPILKTTVSEGEVSGIFMEFKLF
jgi:hypothetical protein